MSASTSTSYEAALDMEIELAIRLGAKGYLGGMRRFRRRQLPFRQCPPLGNRHARRRVDELDGARRELDVQAAAGRLRDLALGLVVEGPVEQADARLEGRGRVHLERVVG